MGISRLHLGDVLAGPGRGLAGDRGGRSGRKENRCFRGLALGVEVWTFEGLRGVCERRRRNVQRTGGLKGRRGKRGYSVGVLVQDSFLVGMG